MKKIGSSIQNQQQSQTEKLIESQKVQDELTQTLQSMGISVQSSGIKVEKDKYFLVNINSDPSMNELLVYYLKVNRHLFFNQNLSRTELK